MKLHFLVFSSIYTTLLSLCLAPISGAQNSNKADESRQHSVVEAFRYNYAQYEKYAFGQDILDTIQKKGNIDTSIHGFAGTIIDALDTMILMGMSSSPEYQHAMSVVRKLSFNFTTDSSGGDKGVVSVFEWTIRLMGGLLSAYQFNGQKKEERFLVEQAQSIADSLSVAWSEKTSIPFSNVNINDGKIWHDPNQPPIVNLAEAGTLTLEWGTLSQFTKNESYRKLAEGSIDAIISTTPVFPGLFDEGIYPSSLAPGLNYVTTGGGFDSFQEYLLKYPVLLGQPSHRYINVWKDAVKSQFKHLLVKTGINNYTFIGDYDVAKKRRVNIFSHLACYIGGNLAYGGRLLQDDEITRIGLEVTESCAGSYKEMALKLGPYGFGFADKNGNFSGWDFVSEARREFYNKHGMFTTVRKFSKQLGQSPFLIISSYWLLAPEVVESVFYAYRITGDERWRDMAWEMFQDMKKYSDTGSGWAPIQNVNDESSGVFGEQQTFLYAETFKYLYLIFDDPKRISLDEFVFNTEGHILKRPTANWGRVQGGDFPYTFITGDHTEQTPVPSQPTQTRPASMLKFQPGSGKLEASKTIASQLGISHKVAEAMHSTLPLL